MKTIQCVAVLFAIALLNGCQTPGKGGFQQTESSSSDSSSGQPGQDAMDQSAAAVDPSPGPGDPKLNPDIIALEQLWGVRSILDPVGFAAAVAKVKTPEQLIEEQQASFAILQPETYAAQIRATLTPGQLVQQQEALADMLDPIRAAAEQEKIKTPERLAA